MSGDLLDHFDGSVQILKMNTVEEMQNKVNFLKDELAKREALMKTLSVRKPKFYSNIFDPYKIG